VLGALACVVLLSLVPAQAAGSISVGDVQVSETNATVDATFTLTRQAGAFAPSRTVSFQTADASATSPADYTGASGTRTFGSTLLFAETQVQYVTVSVRGDALDENAESFRLVVTGAEVDDGNASATILDDDPLPALTVADSAAVNEGTAGAQARFAVRLSVASGRSVSVAYTTADAGATANQDYAPRSGTLTVGAGTTQATIDVPVLDDGADEPAESFELRLSGPTSATLARAVASATIADDDEPAAPPAPAPGSSAQAPAGTSPLLTPTAPTTGSSGKAPSLGLSSPRLQRPSTILVTVSCPQSAGRCTGRITIFSVPNRRSRIKALRRERRLGARTYAISGGRAKTIALPLGRTDRALLRRTGRMRVRAYALTQDSAGRAGVRTVNGTLIFRTTHTTPGERASHRRAGTGNE
jgi:hypothetical protein